MDKTSFSALAMKREIQARMHERYGHLTPEQRRKQVHDDLMASDSPSARLYQREMAKREAATLPGRVAEDPALYNAQTKATE